MNYLVETYASKIKTLGIFWIAYGVLNLIVGLVGMTFLRGFMSHWGWNHGPWGGGFPFGPWFGPAMLHFEIAAIWVRTVLAVAAGWGLMERAQWGRFVAMVAAFLNILKFPPFGTALGIVTLVLLLGYRNTTLYTQLQRTPIVF